MNAAGIANDDIVRIAVNCGSIYVTVVFRIEAKAMHFVSQVKAGSMIVVVDGVDLLPVFMDNNATTISTVLTPDTTVAATSAAGAVDASADSEELESDTVLSAVVPAVVASVVFLGLTVAVIWHRNGAKKQQSIPNPTKQLEGGMTLPPNHLQHYAPSTDGNVADSSTSGSISIATTAFPFRNGTVNGTPGSTNTFSIGSQSSKRSTPRPLTLVEGVARAPTAAHGEHNVLDPVQRTASDDFVSSLGALDMLNVVGPGLNSTQEVHRLLSTGSAAGSRSLNDFKETDFVNGSLMSTPNSIVQTASVASLVATGGPLNTWPQSSQPYHFATATPRALSGHDSLRHASNSSGPTRQTSEV
jgi:hypothetical protein